MVPQALASGEGMHGYNIKLGGVVVCSARGTEVWHCSCLGTMALTSVGVEILISFHLNSLHLISFTILGL